MVACNAWRALVLVVLCLSGVAQADCALHLAARMNLQRFGTRPLITATINKEPVLLLVDTGAQGFSLTEAAAIRLMLPMDMKRRTRSITISGNHVSDNVIVHQLVFADLVASKISASVVPYIKPERGVQPDGILGEVVLNQFDLLFDFPNQRLDFYTRDSCIPEVAPWPGRFQRVEITARQNLMFIPVTLNGQTLSAMFDTGSRGETVSRSAALRVGVTEQQLEQDSDSEGSTTVNHYRIKRHRFEQLQVGQEHFNQLTIDVVDFDQQDTDMLLGGDYMRWRRFFISQQGHFMYIQKDPDDKIREEVNAMRAGRPPSDQATDH